MTNPRRLYLKVALKFLLLLGLGLAAIPFVASLRHNNNSAETPNPWYVEVNLAQLAPGQRQSVAWPGGEVWIYARTAAEIDALRTADTATLHDPDSVNSQQPAAARNAYRSIRPEYFVVLPRETKRGCQVQQIQLREGVSGYSEACYAARFDNAGRIFTDTGQAEQQNLPIPPYEFISADRLRLLPTVP